MSPRLFTVIFFCVSLQLFAATPRDGFFRTSDGVQLHYLDSGKGQTIIFVPGWTMPAEIWQSQIDHFSRTYRVIAFDPRSQGRSDRPTEGHYPDRRALDIKELISHLQAKDPVLVGWSLAVSELLMYVEQFGTSNVGGFVFVDGWIQGEPNPQFDAAMKGMLKSAQLDRKKFTDGFVRSMYRSKRP
jgi:microsomal epoxide hydrolase